MTECPFCRKKIVAREPTVEIFGGFLEFEEGLSDPIFVHDSDVLAPVWAHLKCLMEVLRRSKQTR